MADVGILEPGERVELIEGEVVRMAAIGSRHAACVKRLNQLLSDAVREDALVQVQDPMRLDEFSEPEPDIALLRPRPDFYATRHPRPEDALLIVEVADATIAYDRDVKMRLYAHAGILEYWIVDLPAGRVEVYRDPGNEGYGEVTVLRRGDTLRPVALPDLEARVNDILP
jgi:Uma2 family endonuclease